MARSAAGITGPNVETGRLEARVGRAFPRPVDPDHRLDEPTVRELTGFGDGPGRSGLLERPAHLTLP